MAKAKEDGKPQRVEIGFSGGQVMSTRLAPERLADLLRVVQRREGWYDLTSEDGEIAIDLRQVVFVRAQAAEHRVGFSEAPGG